MESWNEIWYNQSYSSDHEVQLPAHLQVHVDALATETNGSKLQKALIEIELANGTEMVSQSQWVWPTMEPFHSQGAQNGTNSREVPVLAIRFPLDLARQWTGAISSPGVPIDFDSQGPGRGLWRYEATVAAFEQIRWKDGTYHVFRIEYEFFPHVVSYQTPWGSRNETASFIEDRSGRATAYFSPQHSAVLEMDVLEQVDVKASIGEEWFVVNRTKATSYVLQPRGG